VKSRHEAIARLSSEVIDMRKYEILYDNIEARKLLTQINRVAKEGLQTTSIGALGSPTGIRVVYGLMQHEVS